MVRKKINIKSKKIIVIILITALLVTGVFAYYLNKNSNSHLNNSGNQTGSINLNPPTEEERQQAEANKKNNDERQNNLRQPSSSNLQIVKPMISTADVSNNNVDVSGLIPELFEKDGICTIELTNNEVVKKTITAVAEGRSTYCPVVSIPKTEFKLKGTWSLKLLYSSSVSSGESDPKQIEIN